MSHLEQGSLKETTGISECVLLLCPCYINLKPEPEPQHSKYLMLHFLFLMFASPKSVSWVVVMLFSSLIFQALLHVGIKLCIPIQS